MSDNLDSILMTWPEFGVFADNLTRLVADNYKDIDVIVGIARSGLPLSTFISNHLGKDMDIIRIRAYDGKTPLEHPMILNTPHLDLKDKTVLLVDDMSDRGETFRHAIDYITKLCKPKKIYTASIFVNERSTFKPDVYLSTVNKWVVFPWEKDPSE